MTKEEEGRKRIDEALADVSGKGIRAEVNRLAEDMTCQFKDRREWIREYVVNAYDAQARTCWISGTEDAERITIKVEDDGHGMDRKAVQDFFVIYRSRKRGDVRAAVGRHGIGKLSAAAVPGQCGFRMSTSNGSECWRVETGRLLDNTPIRLERLTEARRPGTRFEITFKKTVSLTEELDSLLQVLNRYVRYLPLEILIFLPEAGIAGLRPRIVRGDWRDGRCAARFYDLHIGEASFDVVLRMGTGRHEVFQNRVLISEDYNLLCHDRTEKTRVPCLDIRVDSPDFQVPFGRHCLRDEHLLIPLAWKLREEIVPAYFRQIAEAYRADRLAELDVTHDTVEAMAVGLVDLEASSRSPWSAFPMWRKVEGGMVHLNALRAENVVYLNSGTAAGVDYSVFQAPVLSEQQPRNGLSILKKVLNERLISLDTKDLVLEGPHERHGGIGEREKRLERHLRFAPDALRNARAQPAGHEDGHGRRLPDRIGDDAMRGFLERMGGVCDEARSAKRDLESTHFRLGYLVQRDGQTPNATHRFLVRENHVVLNLHHPEIRKLIEVAEQAPALAGHWGLALCLTESQGLLPHLTPEAREDLILWDAMAKVGFTEWPDEGQEEKADDEDEVALFIRMARRLEQA